MGESDISAEDQDEMEFEKSIVKNPVYFVVDDWYNEHDKLSLVECEPINIRPALIESLSWMMIGFPGWSVHISLGDSAIQVSSVGVFLGGRRFWDCNSVEGITEQCSRAVDFGIASSFPEAMYSLWRSVVTGEFECAEQIEPPSERQWLETIQSLRDRCARDTKERLSSNAYHQIRYDLHPETRCDLVKRFLSEVSFLTTDQMKNARPHILKDAGESFSQCANEEELVSMVHSITVAQNAAAKKLAATDVVTWWANILHSVGEPALTVRTVITHELRKELSLADELTQLSAIFGLALLHTNDIAFVVSEALNRNERWLANPALSKWLERLKAGKTNYPESSFCEWVRKLESPIQL
jgi:hypothetical protein